MEVRTELEFPGLGKQKRPLPDGNKVRLKLLIQSKKVSPARQVRI